MSIPLYSIDDIRTIEQAAFLKQDSFFWMKAAGDAVFKKAQELVKPPACVLVIVGTGNNGGDASIVAQKLKESGYNVMLLLAGDKTKNLPPDAKKALMAWQTQGGLVIDAQNLLQVLPQTQLIIDGLLGIGFNRCLSYSYQQLITTVNNANKPVLAIDIASGLQANTGVINPIAIRASKTVTFFGAKPGLFTADGKDYSGYVHIETLGETLNLTTNGHLLTQMPLSYLPRRHNTHKGTYKTTVLFGGNYGMLGALVLAARAATCFGVGKVRAFAMARCPRVDWQHPEIMWQPVVADCNLPLPSASSYAIGMGLGLSNKAKQLLSKVIETPAPILLDADALTLLAQNSDYCPAVIRRSSPTILTPHPQEAARLLATTTDSINKDRITAAQKIAQKWQAITVLKGSGTVISHPKQQWVICQAGNPGLARAGSGDVLSGILAALLAQYDNSWLATQLGVFLHAVASDELCAINGQLKLNINYLAETASKHFTKSHACP